MSRPKKVPKKITKADQLLWARRERRRRDIENGEYNARKRNVWKTTKKDKLGRESNNIKEWGND